MNNLPDYLAYHGLPNVRPVEDNQIVMPLHGRHITIVPKADHCIATWQNKEIVLRYDELPLVKHRQFAKYTLVNPDSLSGVCQIDDILPIKASDTAIRLMLFYPGDVIVTSRLVCYEGAGMQKAACLRRVL